MKTSRIIAKLIDYTLFFTVLYGIGFSYLTMIFITASLPLLFAPVEALMLYAFKTTPGKWIKNIKLSEKRSLWKCLKFSFKKALLILPLFFAPLNLFFILFYLKESKQHSRKRWSDFEGAEIVEINRSRALKYTVLFFMILAVTFTYVPTTVKDDIYNISHQELVLKNWVEVKDTKLNFQVFFPEKPTVEKKEVEVKEQNTTLDVTEYVHLDKVSYTLQSSKIPSSWTLFGSKYLFKALTKPLEQYQGKIVKKEIKKHGSLPAMSYLLNNDGGGQTKGRLILKDKTIYKLEVTSKKNLSNDEIALAHNFIESFNVS